jgi:O-antigen ligase
MNAIAMKSQGAASAQAAALLEKGFALISLLFFTQGLHTVFESQPAIVSLLRYVVLGLSTGLLMARWKTTLYALYRGRGLWPLILWSIISVNWSIFPDVTLESIRAEILPMTCFSLYFASRFRPREQLKLVATALGIAAVLSLFYALARPDIGIETTGGHTGAWKGIYAQKNTLSAMMTMTVAVFFILGLHNRNPIERLISRLGLAFSILVILLSTSKTGLIVFVLILFALMGFKNFRWRGRRTILAADLVGFTLLIAGGYLFSNWVTIIAGIGRDPTMSGRTVIWAGCFEKIAQRPWLGYGREAFWIDGNPDIVNIGDILHQDFTFIPAHAHNGLIDVALDLGLVGVGIFLIGLILTLGLALKRAYRATAPEDLFSLGILIVLIMSNVTESILMKRANFFWVMYLVTFLSLRLWPKASTPLTQLAD